MPAIRWAARSRCARTDSCGHVDSLRLAAPQRLAKTESRARTRFRRSTDLFREPTRMARLPGMLEFSQGVRRGMRARFEGRNNHLLIAFEGRIIWRSR